MSDEPSDKWVHSTGFHHVGQFIHWREDGQWWSGIIAESDHANLRVRVRDIRPGMVRV